MSTPNHQSSELIVLVALNFHNEWIADIRQILSSEDAITHLHYRDIYRAMCQFFDAGQDFDIVSAAMAAGKTASFGADMLLTIPADLWFTSKLDQGKLLTHVRAVQQDYVQRQLEEAGRRGESVQEMLTKMADMRGRDQDRHYDAADLAMVTYAEAAVTQDRYPFPVEALNYPTRGGFRKDELVIVAARPGGGKTVMLLQMAWHLAKQGKRALFFSAEMSAASLGQRLASMIAQRNLQDVKTEEERDALAAAVEIISNHPLTIHEAIDVGSIEQFLRAHQGQYDVIFVDYLQQLHKQGVKAGDYELATAVTRDLDGMSMRYGLPFVVASQFNRAADGQQPSMASLRSSGMIEQAADIVISLWGDSAARTDAAQVKIHVDVLKNRNGFTAVNGGGREYALMLNKPVFTFSDMAQRPEVYGHA